MRNVNFIYQRAGYLVDDMVMDIEKAKTVRSTEAMNSGISQEVIA